MTECWVEFPVLYSRSLLIICHLSYIKEQRAVETGHRMQRTAPDLQGFSLEALAIPLGILFSSEPGALASAYLIQCPVDEHGVKYLTFIFSCNPWISSLLIRLLLSYETDNEAEAHRCWAAAGGLTGGYQLPGQLWGWYVECSAVSIPLWGFQTCNFIMALWLAIITILQTRKVKHKATKSPAKEGSWKGVKPGVASAVC